MDLLLIVMGVSGSGKSTIGRTLAGKLGVPFYDGDDFHPDANIQKMKAGKPLNDDDRKPWLQALNAFARKQTVDKTIVIACSALKESYRRIISEHVPTRFIYLKGSIETIHKRMVQREGHFMPLSLLKSQFDTLEEPEEALIINIDKDPDLMTSEILNKLAEEGVSSHNKSI